MKSGTIFLIAIAIGIIGCIILMHLLAWWWIFAPVTFIMSLLFRFNKARTAFFAGFLIVFLAWMISYLIKDIQNDSVMSKRISDVFSLPNQYILFLLSSFIMSVIGGLASLSVYFLYRKQS